MNDSKLEREQVVEFVRKAIEDRATWFHLLIKEAQAAGVNAEDLARKAVYEFGCLKGAKMQPTEDMQEFMKQFAGYPGRYVFEMEVKELDDQQAVLEFNYCPLVAAWQRLGCSPQELDALCDWAMEGDRGVMSKFPAIKMDIEQRIGAGHKCCRLVFRKEN